MVAVGTPVLKVPSAVIPIEFNYILNPQHLDLKLMLDPPMEFKFDDRMWKASSWSMPWYKRGKKTFEERLKME